MALSAIRKKFGIHSVSPYSRTTGEFAGIIKCLKGSSIELSGEQILLQGGTNKYPWAAETSKISSTMSLKVSQFENFMFELFLGKAPTPVTAEAAGSVTTLTNKKGTSVMVGTTGIASVGLKSGGSANLKFGKYVVKATGAAACDVYFSSDADITRGTDGTYQNDLLKITASPLTIVTGATATEIPNFGLELIGGSGTIALVTGDTATFTVLPVHTGAMSVTIGGVADTFPEFGAIIMAAKESDGSLFEVDVFKAVASGMPLGFEMDAYSEAEIKCTLLYDSVKDGVFSIRHVNPS